jgi:Tol biopolymer transport system component
MYAMGGAPGDLRQLTFGPSIDTHPAWRLDGRSFAFASTLDGNANGKNFNLFRVDLDDNGHPGVTTQITFGARHEVSPSFAPDGSIVYASAALDSFDSHLERVAPDGAITLVTSGHGEGAPAVSPDGAWIAYTCQQTTPVDRETDAAAPPTVVATIQHRDLCVRPSSMPADSAATIAPVVSLAPSDEDGPVWSRDGRYLFATSAVWGENGVLFSSVIFVDMTERPRKARILLDHGGPAPRMTPAVATGQLISADLAQNPEYVSSLVRIMSRRIQQQVRAEQDANSTSP